MSRRGSVTGIVLAGGRSSRFGGDKLAAQVDGVPLLRLAIRSLEGLVDEIVVAGSALPPDLASSDLLRLVADEEPFGGPLPAIGRSLEAARAEVAVVVGGDMPTIVPDVLRAMLNRIAADPAVEAVVLGGPADEVVGSRRRVLPLALCVAPARSAATSLLASGDRSIRGLVDRLAATEVPVQAWLALDPEARTLLDVDTPSDLERVRSAISRPAGRREVR